MNKSSTSKRRGDLQHGGRQSIQPLLDKVKLKKEPNKHLPPELFSETAEKVAKAIAENKRGPKPSQVRKFFNELVMWEERCQQDKKNFPEYLPFIRMLNAKAAYAKGRKHVTENFVKLMEHCLKQVCDIETLRNFRLFFEAFLGYYRLHGPRD